MGEKSPAVDAYIAGSADFAKPILKHLRAVVHAGCPETEEVLKWGFPHFMYKGILCSMAAFKSHCAFGFWKGQLLAEQHPELAATRESAMGEFGRIARRSDLPGRTILLRYVKEAAALNDAGAKVPARQRPKKPRSLEVPDYFMSALRKSRRAMGTFEGFSPSHKREYVDWVGEAKGEGTRNKRLETAVAWMSEGKVRNWKYVPK